LIANGDAGHHFRERGAAASGRSEESRGKIDPDHFARGRPRGPRVYDHSNGAQLCLSGRRLRDEIFNASMIEPGIGSGIFVQQGSGHRLSFHPYMDALSAANAVGQNNDKNVIIHSSLTHFW
jgi:hypothetical protein